MKKLLFVIFFPITIPVYIYFKICSFLFSWIIDTFIPFMKNKAFPAFKIKILHVINKFMQKRSAEKEDINHNQNPILNDHSPTSKIDYSLYPLAESDDPLFIRALAVATYEEIFTTYTLQKELNIPYGRAKIIINQLLDSKLISVFKDNSYFANISFALLNTVLTNDDFSKNLLAQTKSQNSNASDKTELNDDEQLLEEYSYKYGDIHYGKSSKIVSLFKNKWRDICKKDFVVLDFETTGLSYATDRIIEIAAIRYVNCVETDKFVYLVNPLIPIPAEATEINNITDEMVADAQTERYLIPQLIEFLSDSLIVGHYANFDMRFLEVAAQRYGYNVSYHYIDTISVSKKIFPGLPNYKLTTIAENLGHDINGMHRAEEDVRVCAEIIKIALDSME